MLCVHKDCKGTPSLQRDCMLHTPDPCGVNNATIVLILEVREPDQEQQEILEDNSSCYASLRAATTPNYIL
jgi:hypothetical protein